MLTTTLRARPCSRPLRRRAGALALALSCVLAVGACSGDDSQEETVEQSSNAPEPDEISDLGPSVPERWTENWCAAVKKDTGAEAIELMGEPTSRADAPGGREEITWSEEFYANLRLVVDGDDQIVDQATNVVNALDSETVDALLCRS